MTELENNMVVGPGFEEPDGLETEDEDHSDAIMQDKVDRMDELHDALKDIGAGLRTTPWK